MCPEEGCLRAFQRYGALQNHILYERHKIARAKITLLDRAKTGYARRLEEHYGTVASKPTPIFSSTGDDETTAEMGWALSKPKAQSKFNEKQKLFLQKKFEEGEISGNKCKGDAVAKEMRRVTDEEGKRIFTTEEFLTEQQITSFFSRLAAKKRNVAAADIVAVEMDEARKQVQGEIVRAMSCHPLTYGDMVLCGMSAEKLSKLKLDKIKDICCHLGLGPVSGRKKAPYIEKLMEEIQNCTCVH